LERKGSSKEQVYTVLNPVAQEAEREVQGLCPRLDTLNGKTVGIINLHGGNEEAIESIAPDLKKAVPDCNVTYHRTEGGHSVGPLTDRDWAIIQACDAVIIGHAF